MTLPPGTRLGSYIIEGPLGAGGMGEVYRARDSKLQRQVAVKVLPELLASDPDRRERFEREAQLLAAFNHPHIAQIYGTVDTNNGAGAIVMEFVDGPTLSDRIAQGPRPRGYPDAPCAGDRGADRLAASVARRRLPEPSRAGAVPPSRHVARVQPHGADARLAVREVTRDTARRL